MRRPAPVALAIGAPPPPPRAPSSTAPAHASVVHLNADGERHDEEDDDDDDDDEPRSPGSCSWRTLAVWLARAAAAAYLAATALSLHHEQHERQVCDGCTPSWRADPGVAVAARAMTARARADGAARTLSDAGVDPDANERGLHANADPAPESDPDALAFVDDLARAALHMRATRRHGPERALRCVTDTGPWLLLGDSTMSEVAHDLALLVGANERREAAARYYAAATRFPGRGVNTDEPNALVLERGRDSRTVVRFAPNHRNMTVEVADPAPRALLRSRFVGHRDLRGDFGGVDAFDELMDAPELVAYVREARLVLVNTAEHDCSRRALEVALADASSSGASGAALLRGAWLADFRGKLASALRKVRAAARPGTRLVYRGSNWATVRSAHGECALLEAEARAVAAANGFEYVDLASFVDPLYRAVPELAAMGAHVSAIHMYRCGGVPGVAPERDLDSCGGLVGKLHVQKVLDAVCP